MSSFYRDVQVFLNLMTTEVSNLGSQLGNLVSDICIRLIRLPALTFVFACRERP